MTVAGRTRVTDVKSFETQNLKKRTRLLTSCQRKASHRCGFILQTVHDVHIWMHRFLQRFLQSIKQVSSEYQAARCRRSKDSEARTPFESGQANVL